MLIDALILSITLIVAIKGFFNGIVKEVTGLIGIVGGIYFASILYHKTGVYISNHLFEIKNPSAVDLVGFITVFITFWLGIIFAGYLISQLLAETAIGVLDRLLGFLFGGLKIFLLISVIIAMLYRIEFIKEKSQRYVKDSIVFPVCLKIGEKILNLSPKDLENLTKNVKIPKN